MAAINKWKRKLEAEKVFGRRTEGEVIQKVESGLQTAVNTGAFDNLPGKGKPLRLDSNPFTKDSALATELLRESGFSLPFIEEKREILAAVSKHENQLLRIWEQYDGSEAARQKWALAKQTFAQEMEKLNKKILTYNLKAPSVQLHLRHIKVTERIAELQNSL